MVGVPRQLRSAWGWRVMGVGGGRCTDGLGSPGGASIVGTHTNDRRFSSPQGEFREADRASVSVRGGTLVLNSCC